MATSEKGARVYLYVNEITRYKTCINRIVHCASLCLNVHTIARKTTFGALIDVLDEDIDTALHQWK